MTSSSWQRDMSHCWSSWSHVRVRVGRGDSVEPVLVGGAVVPQSASGRGFTHFRILAPYSFPSRSSSTHRDLELVIPL